MTGNEIFERALSLLGFTPADNQSVSCKALKARMPQILNRILTDLKLPQINDLSQSIDATALKLDAVCCGCTMLLALSDGDNTKNRIFTEIYNARRAAALGERTLKEDTLPKAYDGGI